MASQRPFGEPLLGEEVIDAQNVAEELQKEQRADAANAPAQRKRSIKVPLAIALALMALAAATIGGLKYKGILFPTEESNEIAVPAPREAPPQTLRGPPPFYPDEVDTDHA
ncbi:hypothetical protein Emag_000105 [Eimeria magna]